MAAVPAPGAWRHELHSFRKKDNRLQLLTTKLYLILTVAMLFLKLCGNS